MKIIGKRIVLTVIISLTALESRGQSIVTNGNLRVRFPDEGWKQSEPPDVLQNAFSKPGIPIKLRFYAVNGIAKQRFYITEFNVAQFNHDQEPIARGFAGYLDGVRRRIARQTSDEITEKQGQRDGLRYYEFGANLPGNLFLDIREVICEDRVYSLELGGDRNGQSEAEPLLDGVLIDGLGTISQSNKVDIDQVRNQAKSNREGYEIARKIGYFIGFCGTGAVIGGFLFFFVLSQRKKKVQPPVIR